MNLGFQSRVFDDHHPPARWVAWGVGLLLIAAGLVAAMMSSSHAVVDRDCSDFSSQAAAQKFYVDAGGPKYDPHRLDADGDGKACDSLPCPCSSATGSSSGTTAMTLRQRARVIAVIDGDTIDVRMASGSKRRVRLLGIDTPEMSPRECSAVAATRSARAMLPRGTRVVLVSDPSQHLKDRYGRLLRYVIKGTTDINHQQVARGWGEVFVIGNNPFKRVAKYRYAQSVAKAKNRGIWGAC